MGLGFFGVGGGHFFGHCSDRKGFEDFSSPGQTYAPAIVFSWGGMPMGK